MCRYPSTAINSWPEAIDNSCMIFIASANYIHPCKYCSYSWNPIASNWQLLKFKYFTPEHKNYETFQMRSRGWQFLWCFSDNPCWRNECERIWVDLETRLGLREEEAFPHEFFSECFWPLRPFPTPLASAWGKASGVLPFAEADSEFSFPLLRFVFGVPTLRPEKSFNRH